MLGAVLSAAGSRAGVFTSPHLDRIEERMAIDGEPCSADELIGLIDRVMPEVLAMDRDGEARTPAEPGPTYFEITTAMALLHFARRGVDFAVLEVGLGGRLDSTNVCRPAVSAITSISFDHTRQLGTTLGSIAREKAGIVKPGVPVVSGVTGPEARRVIRRVARQRGAPLIELGTDFEFRYHPPRGLESGPAPGALDFRFTGPGGNGRAPYEGVALALLGEHQAANAAVALAVLAELADRGWAVPEGAVRAGLAGLRWPARVELVARRPAVVLDAAHNVASVEALVAVLDQSFSARRRLLVFATTQEKDARGMLGWLLGRFDEVIFTRYVNNPRSVPPEELAGLAEELTGRRWGTCAGPAEAWAAARRRAGPDDLICVTGSFFIAAEVRSLVRHDPLVQETLS
jgi:dihydrofolate synthase/folylpolyglutamate synthase